MANVVLFLDVDGTILCAPEHATHSSMVNRKVVNKTVNGSPFVTEKVFTVETEIWWRETVANFFTTNQHAVKIVWLTGWGDNARLLETFFPATSVDCLQWERSMDESGKKVALEAWLTENPVDAFIWADDVATVTSAPHQFTIPHLILPPKEDVGLSDSELNIMQTFVNTHS